MVSTKSLHKLAELMRADPEADAAAKMVDDAADEIDRLQSFFAQTLPFLREAWEACFDGKKEKLLSCEERGMGVLLAQFQELADGKPSLPLGTVTSKDCDQRVTQAAAWAHRILGSPNELREPLRQWMRIGETCADGLDRANAEVDRLRAKLQDANARASAAEIFLEEKSELVDLLNEGHPMDGELWEIMKKERDALRKAVGKMSNRRCRACGHVGYYLRDTIPSCECEQCGSADTRLIRNETQKGEVERP
jgi:ribosomal protein L37E